MLEKYIERRISLYAKSRGFLSYKFTSPGCAGVPDRIFVSPSGVTCYMEIKQPDGKLSRVQAEQIHALISRGVPCGVAWSYDEGATMIDAWEWEYENKITLMNGTVYFVYPMASKIGEPGDDNYISAIFHREDMANAYCEQFWPDTGEVRPGTISVPNQSL